MTRRRLRVDFFHLFDDDDLFPVKIILVTKTSRFTLGVSLVRRYKLNIATMTRKKIGVGTITRAEVRG